MPLWGFISIQTRSHAFSLKKFWILYANFMKYIETQRDKREKGFLYDGKLSMTSCLASSKSIGSSKNLLMETSSERPFRRLVLIMNSRANALAGCASRGLMVIDLSRGSPGTICQWWKTDRQKDWPCVWVLRSVSKPKESIAGMKALMMYRGEPGIGASCVTWPRRRANTVYTEETQSAGACTSTNM